MKTPLLLHAERWGHGCGASECARAQHICLVRGDVPCDICLIGEAPGESEDMEGQPFIGPAGHLLDQIVEQAVPDGLSVAFTNIVGCIPRETLGSKLEKPDDAQVYHCAERLQEFIRIASPKLIIAVGGFSRDWLDTKNMHHVALLDKEGWPIPIVDITHPSYILRCTYVQRGIKVQEASLTISDAIEEYLGATNG